MTDRADLPARLRAHSGANIDLAIAVDCAKAAERIEVLEAALAEIAKQHTSAELPDFFDEDQVSDADYTGAFDACVERARSALTPESPQ